MRAATSTWRAWHGTRHLGFGGLGLAVVHLWSGPVEVPGRDDIAQIVWPLTPTLLALACLDGARTAHHPGELLTPRGAVVVRTGYLGALAALGALLLVPASAGAGVDASVLARNGTLLCGLALLTLELLPPAVAWTPLVVVPMLTWLLGSNGLGVPPEPWAVLLEPAGSATARTVTALVAAAGIGAYLGAPARRDVERARLRRRSQRAGGPGRTVAVSGARSGR